MSNSKDIIVEYPFGNPNEENGYAIFPEKLQNESHIFFHGTAKKNLASILKNNFQITTHLQSISFSKKPNLALNYGCTKRSKESPEGVIIVVKLPTIEKPYVVYEGGIAHLFMPHECLPIIIGYSVINSEYIYS